MTDENEAARQEAAELIYMRTVEFQEKIKQDALDAARYRWLRAADFSDVSTSEIRGKPWAVYLQPNIQIPTMVPCRGAELDLACDAAISAEKKDGA